MSDEKFTSNENTESAQVAAPSEQLSLAQSVYSDSQSFSDVMKAERNTNSDKDNGKDGFLSFPSLYPGEGGAKSGLQFPRPYENPAEQSKPTNHGGLDQGAKEKPPEMGGIPGRPDTQKPEDGGKFGQGGREMPHKETKPTDGTEKKPENNDKGQQEQHDVIPGGKLDNQSDKKGPYENNYPNGDLKPTNGGKLENHDKQAPENKGPMGDITRSDNKFEPQERKAPENKGPMGEITRSDNKFEPQDKKAPENNGPFGGLNPAEGKWGKQPGPSDGPTGKSDKDWIRSDKTGSDQGKGHGPMDNPPNPNDAPVRDGKKTGSDQGKEQKQTTDDKGMKRYEDNTRPRYEGAHGSDKHGAKTTDKSGASAFGSKLDLGQINAIQKSYYNFNNKK